MNGAIHAASTQQGGIGGVDNGLGRFLRDVGWTVQLKALVPS
jgi:hypothetical protein